MIRGLKYWLFSKSNVLYMTFITKKILLEQALQRETTPKEGFFTLVFVKETAFFFFSFPFILWCTVLESGIFMIQESG